MSLSDQIVKWVWGDRSRDLEFSVQCDASGVTQIAKSKTGEQRVQVSWSQITDIYGFKKDCYAFDQIRVAVGFVNDFQQLNDDLRFWIEITEEESGFKELISELPRHLPGCLSVDDWWQMVALPPLKTQWTQIYKAEPLPTDALQSDGVCR